jgi:hypothetical protein
MAVATRVSGGHASQLEQQFADRTAHMSDAELQLHGLLFKKIRADEGEEDAALDVIQELVVDHQEGTPLGRIRNSIYDVKGEGWEIE